MTHANLSRGPDDAAKLKEPLAVNAPWSRPWQDVVDTLGVDRDQGLSHEEAADRQHRIGRNRLRERHRTRAYEVLVNQFKSVILVLLTIAAAVSLAIGDWAEIATLTEEAAQESTPLEKRLEQLGRRLIWVTLAIAIVVAVAGVLAGRAWGVMVETSIALAVAAIPEGLPIVATLALARGMLRMARRHAVVQRLAAVETLGARSVICTDKTGTLTKNELAVRWLCLNEGVVETQHDSVAVLDGRPLTQEESRRLLELLTVGVLCNNAALHDDGTSVGDLRLLGLVGFVDPPRQDAAPAIEACQRAGIQVVMVTGDQSLTARGIAEAVHLIADEDHRVFNGQDIQRLQDSAAELRKVRVFARVTPRQKLDLIAAFQRSGQVVAMTGDGVKVLRSRFFHCRFCS